jgi:hypothetical protein
VRELEIPNLHIVMQEVGTPKITPRSVARASDSKAEAIRKHAELGENLSFAEDLLADSILEDPAEYERQIIEGELEAGEDT